MLDRVTARAQGGATPQDAGTLLDESVALAAYGPAIGLLAHLVGDELEGAPWASLDAARFGLTLREGGLRSRAELARGE